VTLAGTQAVVGSLVALVVLVNGMQELYSTEVHDALTEIVESDEAEQLGLTLEDARTILRYSIMVLAVLSAASLVLGFYVLRRHRTSRVALTVIGSVVALLALAGGPAGWAVTAYIGVSLGLLWTRSARAWFDEGRPGPPAEDGRGSPPVPPRQGPPAPPPRQGPPPPPPPPRQDPPPSR
jgi:hypothetical protein